MTREIKFRAWNPNANKMIKFDFNNMVIPKIYEQLYSINDVFATGLRVMQYTGINDNNDEEIYEGGIVHGINRLFDEYSRPVEVTFLNGCFMFGNHNAHEYFNRHQKIEVIGNIYENPDLLVVTP